MAFKSVWSQITIKNLSVISQMRRVEKIVFAAIPGDLGERTYIWPWNARLSLHLNVS